MTTTALRLTKVYSTLLLFLQVQSYVRVSFSSNNPDGPVLVDRGYGSTHLCSSCSENIGKVACKQLGFRDGTSYDHYSKASRLLNGYACTGNETTLDECTLSQNCSCKHYAAARCRGAIRIRSSSATTGELEVYYKSLGGRLDWGSFYSEGWTDSEAEVACRQLGYRSGTAFNMKFFFHRYVWQAHFDCQGNESYLLQCVLRDRQCYNCQILAGVACTVDGGWSKWSGYRPCTVTCGTGHQRRTRTCTNPQPVNGGRNCPGSPDDYKDCTRSSCPVNGSWSAWGPYHQCPVSCGPGQKKRTRGCTTPVPAHVGLTCRVESFDFRPCTRSPCPVNGSWSAWGPYHQCLVSCGPGQQEITRECTNPVPAHGGLTCLGESLDFRPCNRSPCPVDGNWGEWNSWGGCSVTCGVGKRTRIGKCDNPKPQYGGEECQGIKTMSQLCNRGKCPGMIYGLVGGAIAVIFLIAVVLIIRRHHITKGRGKHGDTVSFSQGSGVIFGSDSRLEGTKSVG